MRKQNDTETPILFMVIRYLKRQEHVLRHTFLIFICKFIFHLLINKSKFFVLSFKI